MPIFRKDLPELPMCPCPFCGNAFSSAFAVYAHWTFCKEYTKYVKKHSKLEVKVLIRGKIFKKYFFQNKTDTPKK